MQTTASEVTTDGLWVAVGRALLRLNAGGYLLRDTRSLRSPSSCWSWLHEIKFDGFRAMAVKHGEMVKLYSRNQNDLRPRFPSIASAIARLGCSDAIIDGEIVALDPKGRSSFQLLQAYDVGARKSSVCQRSRPRSCPTSWRIKRSFR